MATVLLYFVSAIAAISIDKLAHPRLSASSHPYFNPADLRNITSIRVIDEDTEELDGYLYPAAMFSPVDLPEQARRALILSYVKP